MHLLKYFLTFVSDLWFENFGDLASTNNSNIKLPAGDSYPTGNWFGSPDARRNWVCGVYVPKLNKVIVIPSVRYNNYERNHGNRFLIYDVATDSYSYSTATLSSASTLARYFDARLLDDYNIFIASGDASPNSAIYNALTDTVTYISPPSPNECVYKCIKLKDNKIFCLTVPVPGYGNTKSFIYDYTTNTWTASVTMSYVFDIQLMLLSDGKVLLLKRSGAAETIDTTTNTRTSTTLTNIKSACLLNNGTVFAMGENTGNGYIWNPATNVTTTLPNVNPYHNFTAGDSPQTVRLLPDGRILIAIINYTTFDACRFMIYDIATNTNTTGGADVPTQIQTTLGLFEPVPLPNGKYLIISSARLSTGKFPLISGSWTTQFPLRQFSGSFLQPSTYSDFIQWAS